MDIFIVHFFVRKMRMHHFIVLVIYPVGLGVMVLLEFYRSPEPGNVQ
jgi:hypothetical protein